MVGDVLVSFDCTQQVSGSMRGTCIFVSFLKYLVFGVFGGHLTKHAKVFRRYGQHCVQASIQHWEIDLIRGFIVGLTSIINIPNPCVHRLSAIPFVNTPTPNMQQAAEAAMTAMMQFLYKLALSRSS